MKICVYAICKNESNFVQRWYDSMKEADEIYVLDTGSTDNTVSLLKKLGVHVKVKEIKPWRFDKARNESLKLVAKDADICVCTDLDEVFDPGWRKILESKFKGYDRGGYNYIWSFDKYGNPAVNFYQEKIHTRKNYKWVNPVHEVLEFSLKEEKKIIIPEINLKHYPDDTKSRGSYLPLLELAVTENPENDRNTHYLGREYMFTGNYEKSIETLKKHLELKTATWKDERSASMRFIARSNLSLKNIDEALKYNLLAIAETPYLREPYVECAFTYYEKLDYYRTIYYLELALLITNQSKSYINEPFCFNGSIEDLLSVCYFFIGNYEKALEFINKALEIDPDNERIKNNKELINEKLNL